MPHCIYCNNWYSSAAGKTRHQNSCIVGKREYYAKLATIKKPKISVRNRISNTTNISNSSSIQQTHVQQINIAENNIIENNITESHTCSRTNEIGMEYNAFLNRFKELLLNDARVLTESNKIDICSSIGTIMLHESDQFARIICFQNGYDSPADAGDYHRYEYNSAILECAISKLIDEYIKATTNLPYKNIGSSHIDLRQCRLKRVNKDIVARFGEDEHPIKPSESTKPLQITDVEG
jgi:hypothetical protein